MGFSWNGIHTSDVGILAEVRTLPVYPEPKIITEEIPGIDGFLDFSTFNNNMRIHFKPREWEYRCSFENRGGYNGSGDYKSGTNPNEGIEAVINLFSSYSGYLIDDKCKNVRWKAVITNNISFTQTARTLNNFPVFIRTQAFAEGLNLVTGEESISGFGEIVINNIGQWYSTPKIYITGQADNMTVNGEKTPFQGNVEMGLIDWIELPKGENSISIIGFSGIVSYELIPYYFWGWD